MLRKIVHWEGNDLKNKSFYCSWFDHVRSFCLVNPQGMQKLANPQIFGHTVNELALSLILLHIIWSIYIYYTYISPNYLVYSRWVSHQPKCFLQSSGHHWTPPASLDVSPIRPGTPHANSEATQPGGGLRGTCEHGGPWPRWRRSMTSFQNSKEDLSQMYGVFPKNNLVSESTSPNWT